jgi:expansin (peptidoglycan-binding protein)
MHATPPRRRIRSGWIWSAVALAAAVSLTWWLIRLQESACAATLPAGSDHGGRAVYYEAGSDVACSYRALPRDGRYVSVSGDDYAGAAACGSYLDVSGPTGRSVRVEVVDRCATCAPGRLDLSRRAFARIADLAKGDVPVRYTPVRDPEQAGALDFEVKPGSSAAWLALLVAGNGNPLRRVEVRQGRSWRSLDHGLDNYWTISGAGGGPFGVRVTDTYGHRSPAARLGFDPGRTQRSGIRLYGGTPSPTPTSARPTPTPSPSVSRTVPPSPARGGCTRTTNALGSLALRT